MAEPQKMVHLSPVQRKRKKFNHPLTDKAPAPLTDERLNQLLLTYFEIGVGDERYANIKQELVISHFRLLRSTVARYLYHWPVTRRFLDEMVSTGIETILRIITGLKPEQLKDDDKFRALGGLVERSIRFDIETIINQFRGIAPASSRTNYRREQEGKKPVYGNIEADLTSEDVKNAREYVDIDSIIFELEDVLREVAKTDFEKQVLMRENWGLSNAELGKKLGKSARWVLAVRNRLRERYHRLGGSYV